MFDDYTPDQRRAVEVFLPRAYQQVIRVHDEHVRFVHYTSAEVAVRIIDSQAIWMRNAMTMNDFSEVEYGAGCLETARGAGVFDRLSGALEDVHPGLLSQVLHDYEGWLPHLSTNTFLTCLSEHRPEEDDHGRLSMWRAYGRRSGVALVLKNTPFVAETDVLGAYSSPVAYLTPHAFEAELREICETASAEISLLQRLPRELVGGLLFTALRFGVLCTKHPGFEEELEWRVIYSPVMRRSATIEERVEIIDGAPQIVQRIPLRNAPSEGLFGAAIPDLLDRVIIGPTEHQAAVYQAFVATLERAGVADAAQKVKISGIPLRSS